MKNKIILFLSFLMIVMCLTGCSEHVIEKERLETVAQIAENVVNQKGYQLPEGYEVSFYDKTTNARISIRDNTNEHKEYMNVIFDITGEKPELVQIKIWSGTSGIIFTIVLFVLFIIAILVIFVGFIKWIARKITGKSKSRKRREGGD